MGLVKRMWMEEQERLYHKSDDNAVCPECFDDPGIKSFIEDNLECETCSVCGRTSEEPIAATADRVSEFFLEKVGQHWEDANDSAPYCSAEGGFLVTTWSMYEIVFDELPDIGPFETLEWLYNHLRDDVVWCERDWQILKPGQALAAGWGKFSEAVKHVTRFLFFTSKRDPYESGEPFEVRPDEMLDALGRAIRKCRLVRRIPAGTHLFRVRGHKRGKRYSTPEQLGPPPRRDAVSAGRMNAPGIVVMYGALDEDTAFTEATGEFRFYSVAEFELLEDILVVDLSRIPQVPSIFEDKPRESIIFLRDFKGDVSRPIRPDQKIHVEYTPTQVVSEFLRHRFRTSSGKSVSGVFYESSKVKHGTNAALFFESEQVEGVLNDRINPKKPALRMLSVKERRPVP
ncbi:MAG: HEPN-associated N-terminal domain-containing protein [Terracidiphilus sp.]